MVKYCLDTSGISHPWEERPEDIHTTLWDFVRQQFSDGHIAVTQEIYDEMILINGGLGSFLKTCKSHLIYEIGQDHWDWAQYIDHTNRMQDVHREFISEFSGGSPKTICLNDMSGIALAKTLGLPLISMERKLPLDASKRRIPNICDAENVRHFTFNDYLRAENYRD